MDAMGLSPFHKLALYMCVIQHFNRNQTSFKNKKID